MAPFVDVGPLGRACKEFVKNRHNSIAVDRLVGIFSGCGGVGDRDAATTIELLNDEAESSAISIHPGHRGRI